ncbi:MAG: hypothetical protein WA803_13885 [Steroidobacteraceae bacterium]
MRRATTTEWMAGSLAVGLAIVWLARTLGYPVNDALRATARWSFALFWLASCGGALATIFGARFRALAQRAREFGLAFASAHLAHLGLVAWVLHVAGSTFSRNLLIFLGLGVFWTYFLAILSIRRLTARLDPRTVRILRTVGVEYISLVFLFDFTLPRFQVDIPYIAEYVPFIVLTLAGPILRIAAAFKRLSQTRALAA